MSDPVAEARLRIRGLLIDQFGDDRLVSVLSDSESLRLAGVSSTGLVNLLVAMEDEFGFEWDDEVAPEALRSIDSLSAHVAGLGLVRTGSAS